MGKSAPRAPAAPDPVALANAQAGANTRTAQEQQRLNMVNSTGPSGSVNYVADPSAPGGYRQVTTLSQAEQQNYDRSNAIYGGALQTAQDQLGRVNNALGQTLNTEGLPELQSGSDFNRQQFEDSVYASHQRQLDPQWARAESNQDARLAAMGLGANSEASRNQRADFARDREDSYANARNQAVQAGGQELSRALQQAQFNNQARTQGLQERAYIQNQPLQQLQALLGTGSVSTPSGVQYTPTSVGQTDVLGANALSLNQQNQNYQSRLAQQQAGLGGLFQLGSAALTAFSDRRLKRGAIRIGRLVSGLGIYAYRYLWSDRVEVGVMADEVQKIKPNAVMVTPSGYLAVNYGAL